MKQCSKCKLSKKDTDFYFRGKNSKTRKHACVDCLKKAARIWAINNPKNQKQFRKNWKVKNKERVLQQAKEYRERNNLKVKCRLTVNREIRGHRMKRGLCAICGSHNTQAHHSDYNKPLDIKWLCRKHHSEIHQILGFAWEWG